ncbi:hypothetical protein AB0I72_12605 [Nocardiopsis sp. NPDC049922]|uniref:SCO7613 C-terminal domain-containing membrane protein n=1 Tax=Nocardiopsis sp. NPDC049922 TaxID=3155157 RepID=UPI003403A91E
MNGQGPPPRRAVPELACPDCRAPLGDRARTCARCGILLVGPRAERLWHIDMELAALVDRTTALDAERTSLLQLLRQESLTAARSGAQEPQDPAAAPAAQGPPTRPAAQAPQDPSVQGFPWTPPASQTPSHSAAPLAPSVQGASPAWPHPAASPDTPPMVVDDALGPDQGFGPDSGQRVVSVSVPGTDPVPGSHAPAHPAATRTGEVTRRSAQNVILGLGGLLVGIAALVFAVWTWSDMGTGTRATVLGLTTLTIAGVALPLHRRGLRASAETFGALAAGLLCVDALALFLLSDGLTNVAGYAAGALAAIGALLALYPLVVPLAGPRVLTVVFAQPVALLTVLATPFDGRWPWLLPAVAATALADAVVARRLGAPRPGRPVRTLYWSALLLWLGAAGVSAIVLFTTAPGVDPERWWAVAATLALLGVTGLLLARRPVPALGLPAGAFAGAALVALGAVPLAAGPASLPALPRMPLAPWSGGNEAVTAPTAVLLGIAVPDPGSPSALVHLVAVLLGAGLAVAATALLLRRFVLPAVAVAAPAALLAVPVLLGFPGVVAAVWAVLCGAALILGAVALRSGHLGWIPVITGTLTLVTGVSWSLSSPHTTAAALLLTAATVLVLALVQARLGVGREDGPARPLYAASVALWALTLIVGGALLVWTRVTGGAAGPTDWSFTALVLTTGAAALVFGRSPNPFAGPGADGAALPPSATIAGLLLLPTAPLLSGPLLAGPGSSPAPPGSAVPHTPWGAPVSALLDPAHEVLGVSVRTGAPAVGVALGVVATGVLAVLVARVADRRWTAAAIALAAPAALVPLPVVLGLPFVVAIVWTVLVGAALTLAVSRVAGGSAWVPAATGTLTLLLGMLWALPERHATLVALAVLSATALANALVLVRIAVPERRDRALRVGVTTVALGFLAVVNGAVCLVAIAAVDGGPVSRWLLAATALMVGTAALTVSRAPHPFTPTPTGAGAAPGGGPAPQRSPFGLVGLVLLAVVPLVAGPRGAPVLAGFARVPFLSPAAPGDLLLPAHVFLGLPGQPDAGTAVAVAFGVVLSGVFAVGATLLLARRWSAHAAALVAPSALVPVPIVLGAPFAVALAWTLAVGSVLVVASAPLRDRRVAWVPGVTGLLTLLLGLCWALPEPYALSAALTAVAVACAVAAALAGTALVAAGGTAVATAATGACALTVPLALGVAVEYAALVPIALVAGVAAVAPRLRSPLLESAEIPAALWAAVAVTVTAVAGTRGELVALALALVGVIALASAVRPRRRWLAGVGGALMLVALWTVLGAWGVTAPEAYTVVPATAALVVGWEWSRKAAPPPSSWAAYGGGLALLLLPTVVMVFDGSGTLWRVPAVLAAGLAVAVWGLRARLQAALVLGATALLVSSLRAFGPPLWDLTVLLPNWVPFAVVGVALLVVGARYESSLARVRRWGALVSGMR